MSKAGVFYNSGTPNDFWLIRVGQDSDLVLNQVSGFHALIEVPLDHQVLGEQLKWRVNTVVGSMELKAVVTLTPTTTTFSADGIDVCSIYISGLVNSAQVAIFPGSFISVSSADPYIEITSDVKQSFNLKLIDYNHWGETLVVEAI